MVETCSGAEALQWGPGLGADFAAEAALFHQLAAARGGPEALGLHGYMGMYPYPGGEAGLAPGWLPRADGFCAPPHCLWDAAWGPWGVEAAQAGLEGGRPGRQQGAGRKKKQQDVQGNQMKNHELIHQEPPWANVTTVMMRNLPNKYSRVKLLEELEGNGFEPLRDFDFFYLPIDHSTAVNLGYCFINFVDTVAANRFAATFQGKRMLRFNSNKTIQVMPASIQGYERNYAYYSSRRVAQDEDPEYRPLFLRPITHRAAVGGMMVGNDWPASPTLAAAAEAWGGLAPPPGLAGRRYGEGDGPTGLPAQSKLCAGGLSSSVVPARPPDRIIGSPQKGKAGDQGKATAAGAAPTEHALPPALGPFAYPPPALPLSLLCSEAGLLLGMERGLPKAEEGGTDTPEAVRRFVTATADILSAGSGYIGAKEGEELVALHAEGDWFYGFVLLDGQRRGWFPRNRVCLDPSDLHPMAPPLPHLLTRSRGSEPPPAVPARRSPEEGEPAAPSGSRAPPRLGRGGPAPIADGGRPAEAIAIRRFVTACAGFEAEGDGYLGAEQGEELVALHCEGDWYYGLVLSDPARRGWFSKDSVTLQV